MNVDTATFEAITDRLDQLAAKVEWLERREQARTAAADFMTAERLTWTSWKSSTAQGARTVRPAPAPPARPGRGPA